MHHFSFYSSLQLYETAHCDRKYERIKSELNICDIYNLDFCEDLPYQDRPTNGREEEAQHPDFVKVAFPRQLRDPECVEAEHRRQSMRQERNNLGLTIGLAIVGTILANILIG